MTLATTACPRRQESKTGGELRRLISSLVEEAQRSPNIAGKVRALWGVEGLVFQFFQTRAPASMTLYELDLPLQAGPPAHCGLAMAAVQQQGFTSDRLFPWLEDRSDHRFVRFAWETVGLMLAVYQRDVFGAITTVLGRCGIINKRRLQTPKSIQSLVMMLPDDQRRLVAHGYGRALYFKRWSLTTAMREAQTQSALPAAAVVRGLVAAYMLVNSNELDTVFQLCDSFGEETIKEAVCGGVLNTLALLEWLFPDCLGVLILPSDKLQSLVTEAAHLAVSAHARHLGPPLVA